MRRFMLLEPRTLENACEMLAQHDDAKAIGGGTALLIMIKQGVYRPTTLVNLKKIGDAAEIAFDPERGLRIGGLATIQQVAASPIVQSHYPVLAKACHVVANIRIRNLATIGGNLAHADYQSDPPAALVALQASVELSSVRGKRVVPLENFLLGSYETAIEPDEIVSAVLVPPAEPFSGTYLKFTTRSSEDRPCAGIAALVRMKDGACADLRLVVGAVSPMPVRVKAAESLAVGQPLTGELIEAIAEEAAAAVDPIDDLRGPAAYKRHLTRVLARRALTTASAGANS